MTANAMEEDRERSSAAGMNDHLVKPLDVDLVFQVLSRWIRVKPGRKASAPELAVAGTPSPLPLPQTLPGIDVVSGLRTCMGKEDLYRRQLLRFRESQSNFASAFRDALEHSDPAVPRRLAHTLKGLAGTIGARALQHAAALLEEACMASDPAPRARALDAVIPELQSILAGLAELPGAVPSAPGPLDAEVDRDRVTALLRRLGQLLMRSDAQAGDMVGEISSVLRGTRLAAPFAPVAQAVASYDFEDAMRELQRLEATLPTAFQSAPDFKPKT